MAESHVATHEWQSFESRMRKRRAERCRLRADLALEAGCLDDARKAFAEAKELDPDSPDLGPLEQRVTDADAAVRAAATRRWRRLAAGAATVALAITGGSLALRRGAGDVEPSPASAAPSAVHAPSSASPKGEPSLTIRSDEVRAREVAPRLQPLEPEPQPQDPAPPVVVTQRADSSRPADPPPDAAPPADDRRDTPRPAINAVGTSGAEPVPALNARATPPIDPLPAAPPPAPTAVDTAPATPPTPPVREDDGVRTVLARYESAYSALDAAAAGAVYPAIDRQKLSRAFEGLAAQQVSLGECEVRVSGAAARAECAGNATWTPKVGGGSRTQTRLWEFDLQRTGDGWQITRATARNRGSN